MEELLQVQILDWTMTFRDVFHTYLLQYQFQETLQLERYPAKFQPYMAEFHNEQLMEISCQTGMDIHAHIRIITQKHGGR